VLTTLCCLNRTACGQRARQRLLTTGRGRAQGIVERSLISSVTEGATNRVTRLRTLTPQQQHLQPPSSSSRGRIQRRSFSNRDLLLSSEKSDSAQNHVDALPSPLESLELDVAKITTTTTTTTSHRFSTKRRSDEAANSHVDDCAIEEEPSEGDAASLVDWKRSSSKASSKVGGFPPASIHTMLMVVTADVVAATAQIGEGGTAPSTMTSTRNCETSACGDPTDKDDFSVDLVTESLANNNIARGGTLSFSATEENLPVTVAKPRET